ncbi:MULTISPECIES: Rne/Rng family ribonuclease [unclassified Psychrobacter]|uniref:Rne/Rng family ribonuclease n=1 Tax=unclassified Psychrobacter TaxID=196806 RepID=UPI0025B2D8BD|nr:MULTISPECIES: Rne/Rng family ribonuclease [unclassified Psychrobacter]MDN3453702.1 Rne/Rng family ribonuclease [Psychrobacter sp. APC 3350]MDN3501280.1 Rne/Rng family ribonuclease [Psychrobacter sp. 5A.1]
MKRILINATQNEEIRVALCKGNHLYDFDLENRTREQKKSNIYKGHVTRVEPSLEAVFVEYGSQRQGFLPIREISAEYLSGNPRDENIKKLIKEGDELIVQVEKEERGNKGAALSTYVSLAGRYLVLMPNNPRGGGISRQISGKLREDMKRMLSNLDLPKGMSVIIRTAGIGKTQEDLQHDLNHLLNIWQAIQEQNQKYPSPRLVHQEAGVVTRAVRDYLRDDIAEIWIDNENAYIEAAGFIDAVMPKQAEKLRKYTDYEPMFSRFNIEKQIETAYQREVRLPSGGSIVIDQTEALVSIDINSAKSTKGSDVAETAYHTNLEAADEIARQLRLRDMGGLVVIDFIDMNDNKHQKEVEKRLIDATKYDRARVQFGDISKFGLMEMSRQRLRPSLEESTGYICPRCHGNGMIRDLRSLSLSIMRQIEQIALKERQGEVQAEVPTDIAAFLLNEKRDSLVYLEQDSGTRITILPHAHLESPNFKLHFNRDGFAPSSYERITDTQQLEHSDLGYNVDWQTAEKERPEQQPTRQPRQPSGDSDNKQSSRSNAQQSPATPSQNSTVTHSNDRRNHKNANDVSSARAPQANKSQSVAAPVAPVATQTTTPANVETAAQPQAVAWLSNLFAQAPQATTTPSVSSRDAAEAIEALVNTGAQSLGSFGQTDNSALTTAANPAQATQQHSNQKNEAQQSDNNANHQQARRNNDSDTDESNNEDRRRRKPRKSRSAKPRQRKDQADESHNEVSSDADNNTSSSAANNADDKQTDNQNKRQQDNRRTNDRNRNNRQDGNQQNSNRNASERNDADNENSPKADEQTRTKRKSHSQRGSRGKLERGETLTADNVKQPNQQASTASNSNKNHSNARRNQDPNEVVLQVNEAPTELKAPEVVHLSLDDSKPTQAKPQPTEKQSSANDVAKDEVAKASNAQPQTNSRSTDKKDADIKVTAEKTTDDKAVEVSEAKIDSTAKDNSHDVQNHVAKAAANTDIKKPVVDEQLVSRSDTESASDTVKPVVAEADSTPVVGKSQEANTPDESATDEVAIDETTKSSNEGDNAEKAVSAQTTSPSVEASNSSSNDSDSVKSNSAVELTHEALFGARYVTAEKFGQASNDPRVVLSQQAQVTPKPQVNEQAAANVPAIRGTVGEFIRATLPEAQTRLAEDGIINCFIATVALHTEQAQTADDSANVEATISSSDATNQRFDFSNYGYQPLAADYLARFESMTQAVSQFAATQGKTDVEPRTIGKRASNDPRGQHPDYQEPAVLSVPTEQTSELISNNEEPLAETQQANSDVDAHDVDATALANRAQTEEVSSDSEQLLEIEHAQSEANNAEVEANAVQDTHVAEADTEVANIEEIDVEEADVAAMAQENDSTVEEATKEAGKDDSQAAKSKTTIASYKNMIENVAEQLLPQTGMFNLTTPKVPKARTRKPKTDHKKPTQAEKLAADETDSES